MIKDIIEANDIRQGDLVFILNTEKLMKTGWYRKVRTSNHDKGEVFYVFEKSIHPKYDPHDKTLEKSRRTRGVFHMKETTIYYGENKNKYNILVRATGISSTLIVQNDYVINFGDLNSLKDIDISKQGVNMLNDLNIIKTHVSWENKVIKSILDGKSQVDGKPLL